MHERVGEGEASVPKAGIDRIVRERTGFQARFIVKGVEALPERIVWHFHGHLQGTGFCQGKVHALCCVLSALIDKAPKRLSVTTTLDD